MEGMSMLKRMVFLSVILLTLTGLVFAGGGSQGGGASGGEVTTIDFWHIQNFDPAPKFIQDAVDRFKADNPDYKVNVSIVANDAYKQKIAVASSAGQYPDVFISWTGGTTNEYVKAGVLADLTPYFNANNYKDKFLDAAISQSTINGKIYAFPAENTAISGVFYNKEIFAKYNLKVPTTIRELEQVMDTLKKNGITPFTLANKTQWCALFYYMQVVTRHGGLEPFAKFLDGSGSFTDETFIYAANKMQDWIKKGYFNEGFNGLDEDSGQSRPLLYTEQVAMQVQGSWFVSNVFGENPEFLKKVGFFAFPADENGKGNPKTICGGTIGDNFYHISSKFKAPAKAFEMLTHLLDEQSVTDRIAANRIPPLKGVGAKLTNPILKDVFAVVEQAPDLQFWYDQALSPDVGEVFKQNLQEVFGLTMTPQELARRMDEAQKKALGR
jgi:raffinose/stachyose/melibiose transport system substrate-binding protein